MLLLALMSNPAEAGGIGLITTAGTHSDVFYAYDLADNQYAVRRQAPDYGMGLQMILGDGNDKYVGTARLWLQQDAAQNDDGVKAAAQDQGWKGTDEEGVANPLTYAYRDTPRNLGLATAGVQWRLWGEPLGFQLNLISNVGAGFMTGDSTEFILAQVGPGVHYTINDSIQVNAELAYEMRFRKSFSHGSTFNLGVRYLID